MTPKEKADSIVLKFSNLLNYDFVSYLQWHNPMDSDRNRRVRKDAKKCALIAVDEILLTNKDESIYGTAFREYWQEVRKEIEQL